MTTLKNIISHSTGVSIPICIGTSRIPKMAGQKSFHLSDLIKTMKRNADNGLQGQRIRATDYNKVLRK